MLSQSIICSQHAVKQESATVQVYIEETAIDPPTGFYCYLTKPLWCKSRLGDKASESGLPNCIFQDFVEFAVGMKLCTVAEDKEFGVSVHHPSSGNFL